MVELICNYTPPQQSLPTLSYVKDWIPILITGIVAYIAYQQYSINRTKLKLDLFEKRYIVYKQVKEFLLATIRQRGIENYDVLMNYTEIGEGKFLFDKDIQNYIKTIIDYNMELDMIKSNLNKDLIVGDLGANIILSSLQTDKNINEATNGNFEEQQNQILKKLVANLDEIDDIFKKYLLIK